jgi:hypothetical protein
LCDPREDLFKIVKRKIVDDKFDPTNSPPSRAMRAGISRDISFRSGSALRWLSSQPAHRAAHIAHLLEVVERRIGSSVLLRI